MPIKQHDIEVYSGMIFAAIYFISVFIFTVALIVILSLL